MYAKKCIHFFYIHSQVLKYVCIFLKLNPAVSNEFATAAFRFGHTLVRNNFGRFDRNNLNMAPSVNLSETMFKPDEAYK